MTLVVVADSCGGRFYEYQFHPLRFNLLFEEEHLELRKQRGTFINIHEKTNQTHHKSYASPHHFKEDSIDKFAHNLTRNLEQALLIHKLNKIIIIAGPHINGLLLKHMHNKTKEKIIKNIHKDLSYLKAEELLEYLQQHQFD